MPMNKKSQLIDMLMMPGVILMVFIAFLVLGLIAVKVYPPLLQTTNMTNTQVGQNVMKIPNILDNMAMASFLILGIIFVVVASVIKLHPITIGIGLVILIIAVYLGGVVNNVMSSMVSVNNDTATQYASMPGLQLVHQNLIPFIIGIGALVLILGYISFTRPSVGVERL